MQKNNLSKRIGVFYVDRETIDNHPEIVMQLMARMIIVDCEYKYVNNQFEYTAISSMFDMKYDNVPTPLYEIIIEEQTDGRIMFFAKNVFMAKSVVIKTNKG